MKMLLGALVGAAILAGCAPMIRAPIVEPHGTQFEGIRALLAKGAGNDPVTLIWVHGMCSQFDHSADGRTAQIREFLDAQLIAVDNVAIPDTKIYLRRQQMSVDGRRVDLYHVMWSPPSIERKRERLCFDSEYKWIVKDARLRDACPSTDESRYFPRPRAALNGVLKAHIMNDCLADAVYYAGANGRSIREALRRALCVALSDGDARNADCMAPPKARNVALISESLGSKALFDAVSCASAHAGTREGEARRRQVQNLAVGLALTTHFYMLANQLPILQLADRADGGCPDADETPLLAERIGPAAHSALARFLATLRGIRPRDANVGEVVVVAFTDPNDLLSYRLTEELPKWLGRIVNVLDSNADTLLGVVERPDHAHLKYRWNEDVGRFLVCGRSLDTQWRTCR